MRTPPLPACLAAALASLLALGCERPPERGDVVAMTVYLVGDPAKGNRMDFDGFMAAYSQFFGTAEQPNLPARSTVQVAGLVQPGMLVEIEVQLVKRGR